MWGLLEAPLVLHAVNMNAVPLFVTQRCSRIAYSRSNIRLLAAVVVYSAVQAFVLLGIAQYALPHSWTGGQGAISMWCVVCGRSHVWCCLTHHTTPPQVSNLPPPRPADQRGHQYVLLGSTGVCATRGELHGVCTPECRRGWLAHCWLGRSLWV